MNSTKVLNLGSRENIFGMPEYTASSRYRGMLHVVLMSKPRHKWHKNCPVLFIASLEAFGQKISDENHSGKQFLITIVCLCSHSATDPMIPHPNRTFRRHQQTPNKKIFHLLWSQLRNFVILLFCLVGSVFQHSMYQKRLLWGKCFCEVGVTENYGPSWGVDSGWCTTANLVINYQLLLLTKTVKYIIANLMAILSQLPQSSRKG